MFSIKIYLLIYGRCKEIHCASFALVLWYNNNYGDLIPIASNPYLYSSKHFTFVFHYILPHMAGASIAGSTVITD